MSIKIKTPDMPEPAQISYVTDSVMRSLEVRSFTDRQIHERDAQWLEMVGPLVEAMEQLMEWQVKNVARWHNPAYDNAHRALSAITEE